MSNDWRPLILPAADPIQIVRSENGDTDVLVDVTTYLINRPQKVKATQHVAFTRTPNGQIYVSQVPVKITTGRINREELNQLYLELARTFALVEHPSCASLVIRAFDRIISILSGERDYLYHHIHPLMNDLITRLVPIVGAWIPPVLKGSMMTYMMKDGHGTSAFNIWAQSDEGQEVLSSFDPATNLIEFSL